MTVLSSLSYSYSAVASEDEVLTLLIYIITPAFLGGASSCSPLTGQHHSANNMPPANPKVKYGLKRVYNTGL